MKKMYPYSDWFNQPVDEDGKVRFTLLRGEHYKCSQSSMVQQLRIAATHCNVRVSITDLENKLSVVVAPKLVATV